MIVFLDFEASSLSKTSFPIEVAWVFEDGRSRSALIRPEADWLDWSPKAETIHGISRETLAQDGVGVAGLAAEMIEVLTGHDLYASAPSWDGKWLSVLLRAAGLPRHALRLSKSDDAFAAAARQAADGRLTEAEIKALVETVIEQTRSTSPTHRALADAQMELDRWRRAAVVASRTPPV